MKEYWYADANGSIWMQRSYTETQEEFAQRAAEKWEHMGIIVFLVKTTRTTDIWEEL